MAALTNCVFVVDSTSAKTKPQVESASAELLLCNRNVHSHEISTKEKLAQSELVRLEKQIACQKNFKNLKTPKENFSLLYIYISRGNPTDAKETFMNIQLSEYFCFNKIYYSRYVSSMFVQSQYSRSKIRYFCCLVGFTTAIKTFCSLSSTQL